MLILQSLLAIVHGVLAAALVGLILLQHGKGADAGASFGGGSSSTVFGSTGSGNFMTRLTSVLAALFLINCLGLAWLGKQQVQRDSLFDTVPFEVGQQGDDADQTNQAQSTEADQSEAGDGSVPAMPDSESISDDTGQMGTEENPGDGGTDVPAMPNGEYIPDDTSQSSTEEKLGDGGTDIPSLPKGSTN